eukprot:TRINITY_DN10534_c0_g1_i1.p1 TRINITY_DN10534_c0_g1~~TRINITY_DN10534_c0_g1_i1.p1  ORF type:complete len:514 (-),score=76.54 TRINITY_DN10534_c0_g1_i1:64-1605(-)
MLLFLYLVFWSVCSAVEQGCPAPVETVPVSLNNPYLQQAIKQLDSLLTDKHSRQPLPAGAVVTVVYDQTPIWSKTFGIVDPRNSNHTTPTLDNVVPIASITKVFTSLMLAQLRDRGVVSLDDPVTKFFPKWAMIDPFYSKREITLRQLASHTAGIPREVPCPWFRMADCTESVIMEMSKKRAYVVPQYSHAHYSNWGIALLGRALEKAVGVDYEVYMNQNFTGPLGMSSSTFDLQSIRDRLIVGTGLIDPLTGNGEIAPLMDIGWSKPMGGMYSSARDMQKFISLMFTESKHNNSHVLNSSTIREFFQPASLFRDGSGGFGLPWEVSFTSGHYIYSKTGEYHGYRSQIALAPLLKLGIFISVAVTPLTDDDTNSAWTIPMMDILIPYFTKALVTLTPKPVLPRNYSSYLGTWRSSDKLPTELNISVEGTNLVLSTVAHDQAKTLVPIAHLSEPKDSLGKPFLTNALKITTLASQSCRWREDGMNTEIMYFEEDAAGTLTGFNFMARDFVRVSA